MHFFTATLALAAASAVRAQSVGADQTVANINNIISQSKTLQTTTESVTLLDFYETGPEVASGFSSISKTASSDYNEMEGGSSKRDTFVKVQQSLLSAVDSKHTILEVSGVAYQTAGALRGLESIVDKIALLLIKEVPVCADTTKTQKTNLDKSLPKTIATYAGGLP